MSLADKRRALVEELSMFDDPHERFQYIIDRAKTAPTLDAKYKIESLLIEGCTSNLWMLPEYRDGLCRFAVDADSVITKGIATLVAEYYDGATAAEVAASDADFLGEVGVTQHLSPNRRNGLTNLVGKVRAFGRLHA